MYWEGVRVAFRYVQALLSRSAGKDPGEQEE